MPMRSGTPMPSLEGATEWLNGGPVTNASLAGKPTLIHFWSLSCHVCVDHMPTIDEWRKTYAPQGLEFVAVHMPRSEGETNLNLVKEAVKENNMEEPVAVDNLHTLVDAFGAENVPTYYLFSAEGKLRAYFLGEKALPMLKTSIERILVETKEAIASPTPPEA